MLAPIIIPTLNRIDHLKRCVTSLEENQEAIDTDLYISIDFPPGNKYEEGYKQICTYLETIKLNFKSVHIVKQEKNLGPILNYYFLFDWIKNLGYTRFIFTEDDNEFSRNFLSYINQGLDRFEDDDSIVAICSSGIAEFKDYPGNVAKTFNFSAQGYGSWVKKKEQMFQEINRKNFETLFSDKKFLKKMIKIDVNLFFAYKAAVLQDHPLYQLPQNNIPVVDMTEKIWMMKVGRFCIAPIVPKSRNYGYDGTGVNCGVRADNGCSILDECESFVYIFSEDMPIHMTRGKLTLLDIINIAGCWIKLYLFLKGRN